MCRNWYYILVNRRSYVTPVLDGTWFSDTRIRVRISTDNHAFMLCVSRRDRVRVSFRVSVRASVSISILWLIRYRGNFFGFTLYL